MKLSIHPAVAVIIALCVTGYLLWLGNVNASAPTQAPADEQPVVYQAT